ncbi:hypothetical protein MIMGU_mgv1a017098mg [Erythranthe guttata]|uniref:Uncharacterized protein n=1 Tax=Erythranthe guttata TaxID=4155 RepID=A0A022R4J4_ERYGU|nr:hypothetical protein MIMGU_mgv1a017098mg [Erythranthe guttata]
MRATDNTSSPQTRNLLNTPLAYNPTRRFFSVCIDRFTRGSKLGPTTRLCQSKRWSLTCQSCTPRNLLLIRHLLLMGNGPGSSIDWPVKLHWLA